MSDMYDWVYSDGTRVEWADVAVAKDKRIEALEGLLRAAKCPNARCDEGAIFHQVRDPETGEYEVVADEQCQWCAERWMLLREGESE